jgi:small subunit ribosomal protein S20
LIIPCYTELGVKVLANIKSAKKRAIQSEKRRKHNASRRTMMRTFIKKVVVAIEAGNKEVATAEFVKLQSVLDTYATKGLVNKNTAARKKSRLSAKIKAL